MEDFDDCNEMPEEGATMPANYDSWKLSTPPEYDELPNESCVCGAGINRNGRIYHLKGCKR